MRRARVVWRDSIHSVSPDPSGDGLLTNDGVLIDPMKVRWLPPVEPKVIVALGLNYADHASELAFKPPLEPLIFLKGPNALTGHQGCSRKPRDADQMHPECELGVVIGRTAKNVSAADAYDVVGGYTVANDYAIREYLENYYRPNLRVKNRDGCTPVGPWLVDREDVPDPMNLQLSTRVNGEVVQTGTTADMVFDIPFLIAFLTKFMTLEPGDLILTGTPKGVRFVKPGDEVVCDVEQIGQLANTIVAEPVSAMPSVELLQ